MDGSFDLSPDTRAEDAREQGVDIAVGAARLTILVPTYHDDPSPLIAALAACDGADQARLIVFDDGSGNGELAQATARALKAYRGPSRLVISADNIGRSAARNRLLAHSDTDWVLLLDADMLPDDSQFLTRYLNAMDTAEGPALISGGFSLKQAEIRPECQLHALQSVRSECLDAAARMREPGRFVFTSNILVHREILDTVAFDDGFTGWGWEDVDWGLRVADAARILHIDNAATHLGLDTDAALKAKYGGSGANFARLVARHPEIAGQMPLTRAARAMQRLGPIAHPLGSLAGWAASQRYLPAPVRLTGLKLFRAARYGRALT